jgi:DNA-binding NarL/FixJ family response regulator
MRSLTGQWPERLARVAKAAGAEAVALVALGDEAPQVASAYGTISPADWPEQLGAGLIRRVSKDGEPHSIALDGSIRGDSDPYVSALLVPARTDPPLVVTFFRRQPEFSADEIGRAVGLGELLTDLYEETRGRLRAATAADNLDERLRAHDDLRPALAAASDAAALLESATRTIARRFEAAATSVMLLGSDGELRVRASVGLSPEIVRSARRRVGEGIAGWVAERQEGLLLQGPVDDWRFRGVDPDAGPALSVPMRVSGDVVGVLNVKRRASADPFDESHLRILASIADDLAASLRHVQRIEQLEQDRGRAVAMAEIAGLAQAGDRRTAARLTCEVFGFNAIGVQTTDGELEVLYAREGASLTGPAAIRVPTGQGTVVFAPGPTSSADDVPLRDRLAPLLVPPRREAGGSSDPAARSEPRPPRSIRVFVVEDHPVLREGLRAIFEAEGDIDVCGIASTAAEAISTLAEARPDVVLCDLGPSTAEDPSALRRLRGVARGVPIIVSGVESDSGTVGAVLREGARGYIRKRATPDEIRAAVRAAAAGLLALHPEWSPLPHAETGPSVTAALPTPPAPTLAASPPPAPPPRTKNGEPEQRSESTAQRLTPQEMEYLRYIGDGYTNKEIAQATVQAEDTVRKGVQALIAKLGAADRTHAVVLALRYGLLT